MLAPKDDAIDAAGGVEGAAGNCAGITACRVDYPSANCRKAATCRVTPTPSNCCRGTCRVTLPSGDSTPGIVYLICFATTDRRKVGVGFVSAIACVGTIRRLVTIAHAVTSTG